MAIKQYIPRCLSALSLFLLFACATPGPAPVWPYPEPPEGDWGYEPPAQPQSGASSSGQGQDYRPPIGSDERERMQPAVSSHPTVQALVAQAEQEQAAGDLDRSAATLERAIRIVNSDPLPWVRLAQLRFEQGNLIQAENLARRSLSFATQGATAAEAWMLIADIKHLQGDSIAAGDAEQRAAGAMRQR